MILITDANIVFSALIDPDCIIAEILKEDLIFSLLLLNSLKRRLNGIGRE